MKRILALLLVLLLLPSVPALAFHESDDAAFLLSDAGLDAAASLIHADALELDGAAILLYERRSGTLVYGKNMDVQRYPASLTKLMTCLLALEYGDPDAEITVTERALADMDPDGSAAGLLPGEVYTLRQLLYCLMVASANDAALVIADHIGGSQADFVAMMNRRAEELGCRNTHFVNAHGMHDEDHYSTARDLAKITEAAMEYDLFLSLYSTASYVLPAMGGREERTLYSTNYLISTAVTDAYYDSRAIGGKTGFTTPAGRCVVCTALDYNAAGEATRSWLAVVLGASGTDGAGNVIYGGFTTVSALFDFCIGSFDTAAYWEAGSRVTAPVKNGETDALLETPDPILALLPTDYDPELLTYDLYFDPPLEAPLEAGTEAGVLRLLYDGVCVGQTALWTLEDVGYTEPEPEARRSRPAGRFPFPLGNPWNRLPARL